LASFSESRSFPALALLVREVRVCGALVAAVGQDHDPGLLQLVEHAPDPLRLLVVHMARQAARHPQDVTRRTGDDLQVHPVPLVLPRVELLVPGHPVDRDEVPSTIT
jgi:hypothetical protein